jgi:hypothetical protein
MQVFTFNPHFIHLFVKTFLALFLKVFTLQGKLILNSITVNNFFYTGELSESNAMVTKRNKINTNSPQACSFDHTIMCSLFYISITHPGTILEGNYLYIQF